MQRLLDLRVSTEGGRTLLEDEVVAHAARGRRPHAVEVLGPRRLEVEVAGPGVTGALQEVDQPEGGAQVSGAEAQVLVVLDAGLAVEVDVEELARPQRLRDAVREVEPGHLLVADLGVDAVQLGTLQALDEREGVADSGQQDVAARLVRLGLDRELQAVALGGHVLAEEVERFLHTVQSDAYVLGGARLGALSAAPGDVRLGAQLGRQVDVADRLAQGVAAHVAVVGGEGAVLEDGVGEEVGGGHRHLHAGRVEGLTEALDVRLALGFGGPEGDQVVVVEGDAVGAELGQALHRLDRVEGTAGGVAEGVPSLPADGPQAEGEPVLGGGLVAHAAAPCLLTTLARLATTISSWRFTN